MFDKMMVAMSIMYGAQIYNEPVLDTYKKIYVDDFYEKNIIKVNFENLTDVNKNEFFEKKRCKKLTIYLGSYNENKWDNNFLRYFNYEQYSRINDADARKYLKESKGDLPYFISLDNGVKKIKTCTYYADAVYKLEGKYDDYFRFGYEPLQQEAFFWWNHGD